MEMPHYKVTTSIGLSTAVYCTISV